VTSPRFVVTGELLRRHYDDFDFGAHVPRDPVQFPHRYRDRADIEVIGFVAASLAFGRVAAFEPHLERICQALGPAPARTLALAGAATPDPEALAAVDTAAALQYRWLKPDDLRALFLAVGRLVAEAGSLEAAFAAGLSPAVKGHHESDAVWAALGAFLLRLREHALAVHADPVERHRAIAFLFPSSTGSAACKRQHMFLRWMVRPPTEGVDFGIWSVLDPADLVCPCDVHTARIGHALGICTKPEPSRKVADELTRSLGLFDGADPVRFDFALAHLGISGGCRATYLQTVCEPCGLREACQWWGRV
jgi:uncharacterized protein (TIGR02757 family)